MARYIEKVKLKLRPLFPYHPLTKDIIILWSKESDRKISEVPKSSFIARQPFVLTLSIRGCRMSIHIVIYCTIEYFVFDTGPDSTYSTVAHYFVLPVPRSSSRESAVQKIHTVAG